MADVRADIVKWARWGVENRSGFHYTEGPNRMSGIGHPGQLPCFCDCSAFVTLCYNWAGAPDPNGQGYNGTGYTGTLLSHGVGVYVGDAVPGDVVVYGPGTGDHTALIVEAGLDPLTVSMGQEGDPNYVRVSQDGRQPQRFLRFSTDSSKPNPPAPPGPSPTPGGFVNVPLPVLSMGPGQPAPYVVNLQTLLNRHNGQLHADGQFGPATAQAVKNFQTVMQIQADGIVGAVTWSKLLGS